MLKQKLALYSKTSQLNGRYIGTYIIYTIIFNLLNELIIKIAFCVDRKAGSLWTVGHTAYILLLHTYFSGTLLRELQLIQDCKN